MSRLIVIEGPDRVGKATQSKLLCDYLNSVGKTATVVEVPIKDNTTYKMIYGMLSNGLAKEFPLAFQILQFLNRYKFQSIDLVSLEHSYDYIIFDRWSLSSTVYGQAEGVSPVVVDALYNMLRKPDYTLVLLGDSHKHEAEDVYEKDNSLQQRVRELYTEWSQKHPRDCHVVHANNSIDLIHSEIVSVLKVCRVIPV